jgi:glutathione S-transferase
MLLIGMFDSPFVRRVAVSLKITGLAFEHANWSVGRDFERIREFSPLGRVPTLVLNDGQVLTDSAAILDWIDDEVGPSRALLPASGRPRRDALQAVAVAIGAAEKARDQIYERVFRPEDRRHEPWLERCRLQMHGALAELEQHCARRGAPSPDDRLSQAEITTTCVSTFIRESVGVELHRYTALAALVQSCESRPEFVTTRLPWSAPKNTLVN